MSKLYPKFSVKCKFLFPLVTTLIGVYLRDLKCFEFIRKLNWKMNFNILFLIFSFLKKEEMDGVKFTAF